MTTFLVALAPGYGIDDLRHASNIKWGDWEELIPDDGGQLVFGGREVTQLLRGDVRITQKNFILGTPYTAKYPPGEELELPLTARQVTELRSCSGSLQYLVGNSRPDIAADVSLVQRENPTEKELYEMNKTIEYLHQTSDIGITLTASLEMEDLCVVDFGDSSFANAEEERTQVGIIVTVTSPKARYGTALASIVDWRSVQTHRQVRSTLSAEAIACDEGTDHSYFACSWLDEIALNRKSAIDVETHCLRIEWGYAVRLAPTWSSSCVFFDGSLSCMTAHSPILGKAAALSHLA